MTRCAYKHFSCDADLVCDSLCAQQMRQTRLLIYQKTNKNEKFLTVSSDQRRRKVPMATRDQLCCKRGLRTISLLFVRLRRYDLLAGCVVTRGCKHQRRTARLGNYRRGDGPQGTITVENAGGETSKIKTTLLWEAARSDHLISVVYLSPLGFYIYKP